MAVLQGAVIPKELCVLQKVNIKFKHYIVIPNSNMQNLCKK